MANDWDQSRFDATLKELLERSDSTSWPRSLNKHAFFVSLKALELTEKADPEKIYHELGREIIAKRSDGSSGPLPVGLAIAAKRASKHWTGSKQFQKQQQRRLRGLSSNELKAWRALIAEKFRSMLKGRGISAAFIKSGWIGVLKQLGPKIGGRFDRSGTHVRGRSKGTVDFAEPGRLQVVIQNTAAAHSEHRGGFHRIGDPPLQQAMDHEEGKMMERIEDEMKGDIEHFNRQQH